MINWPDEQVSLVPVEPIKKIKGILVYDVSKLFTEEDSLCYTTLAFFCPNGHLVSVTNQAERTEVDQLSPCEVCEVTHLRAVKNWPESGTELVPKDPLKEVDENPIYEVKDLFSGDHPVDWEVHLDPDLFPILLKEKK